MNTRPDLPSLGPLKAAIWLYFALLLGEGVLRKWLLPGFSDVLLIVRDPVVLLIYFLALQARVFPLRPALFVLAPIVLFSVIFAVFIEVPPMVALFGLRTNYLHIPLVFIMAQTMDRADVVRFGRAFLLTSIPIFVLMLMQFEAAPNSWLNAGAGGADGGQIRGAMGRTRPPGPFSFVDGVVAYFTLVTVFVYYGWTRSGVYRRWFVFIATLATVFAVPISISRSLLMGVAAVLVFGVIASLRDIKSIARYSFPLAIAGVCVTLLSQTVYLQAFATRWDESVMANNGSFKTNVLARVLDIYSVPFGLLPDLPLMGHGIGVGTLAGSRLMTGKVSFLLSETELPRIVTELGPLLGLAFIAWRFWLSLNLVFGGWRNFWRERQPLSWMLGGATFMSVAAGQWGSNTQLGFAIFGSGLALAARNNPPAEAEPEAVEAGLADEESEEMEEEKPLSA